jgi:GNAT superfamily N-acetyltransferase
LSFLLKEFEYTSLSDPELAALVGLMEEKCLEEDPDDPLPSRERILAYFAIPEEDVRVSRWAVWRDRELAALAEYTHLLTEENRDVAEACIFVARASRQQGLGRSLLLPTVEQARRDAVRTLVGDTGEGSGHAFCSRLGAEVAISDEIVQLRLAEVSLSDVERQEHTLAAKACAAEPLELVFFTDAIPEGHLPALAELFNASTPPTGGFRLQAEQRPSESIAARFAGHVARGSHFSIVIARAAASGRFVGSSHVAWDDNTPTHVWQYRTGVHPDYRRRGIAYWMKIAMLRRLLEGGKARVFRAHRPDVNDPIRNLNERMGFLPYQKSWKWQIDVAQVADYLARRGILASSALT